MIKEFFVFGSCNSRDIFNSDLNKNYKKFFRIIDDCQRTSFISLMQNPVEFDESKIQVFNDGEFSDFGTRVVREDLNKNFLKKLTSKNAEYLLMDTHFEVDAGIFELFDGSLLTNNEDIKKTELYSEMDIKRFITIQKDTEEYLHLFKNSCDLFFRFIKKYCPHLKIILNAVRWVPNILKDNGEIYNSKKFSIMSYNHNKYRYILDKYICENYDVEILPFNYNLCALESHKWSFHPSHHEYKYFDEKNQQMQEIFNRNDLFNSNQYIELNNKFREIQRINSMYNDYNNLLINTNNVYSEKINNLNEENTFLNNKYGNENNYSHDYLNNGIVILEKKHNLLDKENHVLLGNYDINSEEFNELKKQNDDYINNNIVFYDEATQLEKNPNWIHSFDIRTEVNKLGTKIYSNENLEGFYYINQKLDKDSDYLLVFNWVDGHAVSPVIQIRESHNMEILTSFQKGQDNVWSIYTTNPKSNVSNGLVDFSGLKFFKYRPIKSNDEIKLFKNGNNIKVYCDDILVINYNVNFHSDFYIGFGGHNFSQRYTIIKDVKLL